MSYGIGTTRRVTNDQSARAGAERSRPAPAKVNPGVIRYLYVCQESSDMPADGEDFPRRVLQGRRFVIPQVTIRCSAGTFTVQLKYDGSVVAQDLEEDTTYPYFFTTPIIYEGNKFITVHVEASSGVTEFEAIFTLVEI